MMCSGFAHPRLLVQVTLLCASAIIAPSLARAQHLPVLNGIVTDASNTPVFGAIVEVAGTALRGRTDEDGHFRIAGIGHGAVDITVRRLGFASVTVTAHVVANQQPAPLNIVLPALPTTVKPVVVHASRVQFTGRLAGYYERLHRHSSGVFVSREEIDRRSNRSLSQLLAATPGINALRLRAGGGGVVRMRGRTCRPLVWIDGVPMPAGEVDLDAFPVNTLHGIELYLGSTTAPFDYAGPQGMSSSSCGTILLWSRGRDTEPTARTAPRLLDVEQMAESRSVFTADQVDTQAELRSPLPLEAIYPASLFAARVEGTAVAEFIVGVTGRIEEGSFAIVSASHPWFGEAVSQAMEGAVYSPAIKDGMAVKQVVHQRFEFSASGKPAKVSALPGR
jgi:TonB family protein